MASVQQVVARLKELSRPDQLEGMARYGISVERRLGVAIPDLRRIAKRLGTDHGLALALWRTGIAEARILASMIADARRLTEAQMERWVKGFDSWDVCDQVCMNLFEKSPLVWRKVDEWSRREEEFVKRAAFALIACLAWHDKEAGDDLFLKVLPRIREGARDNRNFVKKAVEWALRNIGKRNRRLNLAAIRAAQEILRLDYPSARWIGKGALKELRSEAVTRRLKEARKRVTTSSPPQVPRNSTRPGDSIEPSGRPNRRRLTGAGNARATSPYAPQPAVPRLPISWEGDARSCPDG